MSLSKSDVDFLACPIVSAVPICQVGSKEFCLNKSTIALEITCRAPRHALDGSIFMVDIQFHDHTMDGRVYWEGNQPHVQYLPRVTTLSPSNGSLAGGNRLTLSGVFNLNTSSVYCKSNEGLFPLCDPDTLSLTVDSLSCTTLPAPNGWRLVFRQSHGLFQSASMWATNTSSDPQADNYFDLNMVQRNSLGRYEIKLVYPEITDVQNYNHWYQTSNPFTAQTVQGFEAINVGSSVNAFAGLSLSSTTSAWVEGSNIPGYWWYAIGSTQGYSGPTLSLKFIFHVQQWFFNCYCSTKASSNH
jgi:hypothetical protein